MRLFVMRHGQAEATSRSGRDEDRELSSEGRHDVERTAREALESIARGPGPSELRIVASSLRRAQQTAAIVRDCLGVVRAVETSDALAPEASPALRWADVARSEDVLLVSHMPHVERLVRHLVREPLDHVLRDGFRTAMMVELEWGEHANGWILNGVFSPKRAR